VRAGGFPNGLGSHSSDLPDRQGRNRPFAVLGEAQAVVPIVPGTLVELAGLRCAEDVTQVLFADGVDHPDHIFPCTEIHHLGGNPLRELHGFFRRLPPDVSFGEGVEARQGLWGERRFGSDLSHTVCCAQV
jgi:hypothetical protein